MPLDRIELSTKLPNRSVLHAIYDGSSGWYRTHPDPCHPSFILSGDFVTNLLCNATDWYHP